MSERSFISRHAGTAALAISILALLASTTGLAEAARHAFVAAIDGHRVSAKPYPNGLLVLGHNKKFAACGDPDGEERQGGQWQDPVRARTELPARHRQPRHVVP